ncbi:MAG: xylulokinase [Betaproteobacteria bacterium]|nr:xylulokinase [Betaproteobacteria bacterium]
MNASDRCVLGVDLGTGSLKCVLLDEGGVLRASAERSYPTHSPASGWAEQDPRDWLQALRGALGELRQTAPGLMARIQAVGLCSAAHIPVLLDDDGRVLRPAILWSDQRSGEQVERLRETLGGTLQELTLNEPGCTWTLPQLRWIGQHEPDVLPRTRTFLSSKDYLSFCLTGVPRMDHGAAAATLMWDAARRSWAPELVRLSGLPDSALPELAAPLEVVGRVSRRAATGFGLTEGIPVIAGTLDSAAELIGCGLLSHGDGGMVRVGTAGGIMAVMQRPRWSPGVITYPHPVGGAFYQQAGTNACAASLRWLRDLGRSLRGSEERALDYEEMDRLAHACEPGAEGLLFHPYLQGERAPYWNPSLRGAFTGLDLRHGWPHMVRAVMEGVAFSLRDCLDMFRGSGAELRSAVMSGGVTRSAVWSQIITDVLELETCTVRNGDSALGAAMLAGVAAGMFSSVESAVQVSVVRERRLVPDRSLHTRHGESFRRYQEVGQFLNRLHDPRQTPPD